MNGLQGYKKAYGEMEDIGGKLAKSMAMDRSKGREAGDFEASLGNIKNRLIGEKTQQP